MNDQPPLEQPKKFKDRLYAVNHNHGNPIIHKDKNGLSANARKKKERELLKGFSKAQIRAMREEARVESEKLFKEKMTRITAEAHEEIKQEDLEAKIGSRAVIERASGARVSGTSLSDVVPEILPNGS